MSAESAESERRFPRRFLIAASGAAAATGAVQAITSPASAADPTTPWMLGGNAGVTGDGSNFLGPLNAVPLIFKTKPAGGALTERMRIAPNGHVGIGVPNPAAQFGVRTAEVTAVAGASTNTTSSATGVRGTADRGAGVRGNSVTSYGVSGTGGFAGVQAQGGSYGSISGGSNIGAYGSGSDYGLYGAGGSFGLYGGGSVCGVYGIGPTGVIGSGSTYGVSGTTTDPNSDAVRGSGGQYGVHGFSARTAGVRGDSGYVGAWGEATTYGVYGLATDGAAQSYGVYGEASNGASFAVFAQGNMHVAGTLSKAAGSFKIDHPLDPDHKWLSHSFVESPDMMNVYNGNAVLDARGEAAVRLPDYFGALNRDFRYQLTPVGAHAPVYVAKEVKDNTFKIAGGTPGLKVSWQVTGIRQDDYATEHPIVVETPKSKADQGTRSFVPAGSSAKAMRLGPRQPAASPAAPDAPLIAIPAIRP